MDKFLRYVVIESAAREGSETIPSSEGQWRMLRLLEAEVRAIGLENIELTREGILFADVPGDPKTPPIGLLAHVDTAAGVPARNIRPLIHENYQGGSIALPKGPQLSPETSPALRRAIGHTLITSDGSTLLGADDKAGVAAIMTAACRWMTEPKRVRPWIRLAFTPDEEIGRGVDGLSVERFRAYCAYTVDGGELGELEAENFNAMNYTVTFRGISSHTGDARGKMVNALYMAAEFIQGIPAHARPETTDGVLGFIHPNAIKGNVEETVIQLLIRDFDAENLKRWVQWLKDSGRALAAKYPGAKVSFRKRGSYANMRENIEKDPRIVGFVVEAMESLGIEPLLRRIRGGTDGATLTEKGVPTPNIFAGGVNFHSRSEWLSVEWLNQAVEVLLALGERWGRESVNNIYH